MPLENFSNLVIAKVPQILPKYLKVYQCISKSIPKYLKVYQKYLKVNLSITVYQSISNSTNVSQSLPKYLKVDQSMYHKVYQSISKSINVSQKSLPKYFKV